MRYWPHEITPVRRIGYLVDGVTYASESEAMTEAMRLLDRFPTLKNVDIHRVETYVKVVR